MLEITLEMGVRFPYFERVFGLEPISCLVFAPELSLTARFLR